MNTPHRKNRLRFVGPAAGAVALALAAPAVAHRGGYVTVALKEPPKPGLPVTGTLSDLVATSNARVVVSSAWQRRAAPAGQLLVRTSQNPRCRYDVRYSVRSLVAASQTAADRVAARLPAESSRHLLDSGVRGNRAFRVVRQPGIGGRVRVDALWVAVLTRRADIAPAGRVAWTEIRVSARSRTGDECHAGTWRESLGPAIGDSLAVARTTLHFTRKG
jgi:hypothetical protein